MPEWSAIPYPSIDQLKAKCGARHLVPASCRLQLFRESVVDHCPTNKMARRIAPASQSCCLHQAGEPILISAVALSGPPQSLPCGESLSRAPAPAAAAVAAAAAGTRRSPGSPNRPGTSAWQAAAEVGEAEAAAEAAAAAAANRSYTPGSA